MFSLLAIGTSRLCLYVQLSSSSFSVSLIKHEGCVELFEISRNEGFFNSGNVAWTLKDTLTVSWLRGWCKCKNDSRPHQQTRQAALRLNLQQKFSTLMELRSPERSGPIVCKCRRFLSFAFLIEEKLNYRVNWSLGKFASDKCEFLVKRNTIQFDDGIFRRRPTPALTAIRILTIYLTTICTSCFPLSFIPHRWCWGDVCRVNW